MGETQGRKHHSGAVQMARSIRWSARQWVYIIGFIGVAVLDAKTPLGVADWLIELIFVWIAATWGSPLEMSIVAAAGTATMIAGLWTSPTALVPFWLGGLNRLVAIGVVWTIVHVARARGIAEAARAKAAAEIKILRGLLPICAGCRCIRAPAGDWHSLESYVARNSEARFTHTYCPTCVEKYFPGMSQAAGQPN